RVAVAAAGKSVNLGTCFWNPLAIAVRTERPARAAADLFAVVLRRVFFARAAASRIVFPRVGLSDLCAEPAARAIERAGGAIETGPAVRAIGVENGRATGVSFQGRADVRADAVIATVPPPELSELLPAPPRRATALAA